jgi:hypothetical protein
LHIAPAVGGIFFPQREMLGLDPRESTPGFKRQIVILDAECRSLKRAAIVMKNVVGLAVSTNTIERVAIEVGNELEVAEQSGWQDILTGEVPVPSLAIVEFDGGRIRTRKTGCGPGVHLENKGWNESKNAIFVSATSETSVADPQPEPAPCFLDRDHVAKLTEHAKIKEKQGGNDSATNDGRDEEEDSTEKIRAAHKPKRILRTVISSMKKSKEFGFQMKREARRRRFDEAPRRAFVGDGLTCNWTIHAEHFPEYVPVLDFTHAVTYLFTASLVVLGKTEEAWEAYKQWMSLAWQGRIGEVIGELREHQLSIGEPDGECADDDPHERLRRVLGYLQNNRERMKYHEYRCEGLPTTSAWMESAVKEMNYRIKGTEMFWNNPAGAEAILQIRAAALSDDDRLVRALTNRPGQTKLRRTNSHPQAA